MRTFFLLTLIGLVCSCSPGEPAQQKSEFKLTGDVEYIMHYVLDPAADHIWDSAGTIITAEGTKELAPTTEEGWKAVAHSAVVVAETGNLLNLPGRALDKQGWSETALGLVDAGLRAKKAADEMDADALFDAGGKLYQVCVACHAAFIEYNDDSAEAVKQTKTNAHH